MKNETCDGELKLFYLFWVYLCCFHVQCLDLSVHEDNIAEPKTGKRLTLTFPSHFSHRLSLFNCCLSVILYLDKGDYSKHSHVMFCPDKQHSFEPFNSFMCLDFVLEL